MVKKESIKLIEYFLESLNEIVKEAEKNIKEEITKEEITKEEITKEEITKEEI